MKNVGLFGRTAAAMAVGAVLLTACSIPGSDDDSDSGDVLATVDTMFGEIEVHEPDDGDLTVVALGWSDAEMALALGVKPVAVRDWQAFGEENKAVGPWATELFGDETPDLVKINDNVVDYEQIQLLEPDVILNTRSAGDEKEFEELNKIAPTVSAPEGTEAFATTWDVQMVQVATALGMKDEGEELVADTEAAIADAAEAHPELAGLSTVSAAKFGDAYGAYLPGDGRFDILADLGMVNAEGLDGLESQGFYATVPGEKVGLFDVDVAVILPIGFTVADVESDKLLQSLQVVKDDRAVVIDPDSPLGGAWGASSILSIQVVLDELVPQLADAAAKL